MPKSAEARWRFQITTFHGHVSYTINTTGAYHSISLITIVILIHILHQEKQPVAGEKHLAQQL